MVDIGWEQAFDRVRRSNSPILVNKQNVGQVPWDFDLKTEFGNLYRSYKRDRLNETIVIREFPTHFTLDVRQNQVGQQTEVVPTQNIGLARRGSEQSSRSPAEDAALLLAGGATLIWALRKLFGEPKPEKTYKLFISHSWDYEDQYERLKEMLEDVPGFAFLDYSVPREDPLDAQSRAELRQQLESKIKLTSAVVIISGMYASYSDIIEMEIDIANELGKPIIGVKPWGNKQVPRKVREEADVVVGWNAQSIANAVQEHA